VVTRSGFAVPAVSTGQVTDADTGSHQRNRSLDLGDQENPILPQKRKRRGGIPVRVVAGDSIERWPSGYEPEELPSGSMRPLECGQGMLERFPIDVNRSGHGGFP